jgi:hypothetical protein
MEAILSPGKDKVRQVTSDKINQKIDNNIARRVDFYSSQSIESIEARIKELEEEWDIERTLELNASLIAFGGVVLAATVSKKWLFLPALITAFLTQHAIQGWCPPIPLFRRLGIRTQKEIETERHALLELLENRKSFV